MMRSKGGESGVVIYSSVLIREGGQEKLTEARPALTPCRPDSQTSLVFSTSFRPEILTASHECEWLDVSIQGRESAIAVRQESSCPSTDAASCPSALNQADITLLTHWYLPSRMYP
jgi:hypothetical protein